MNFELFCIDLKDCFCANGITFPAGDGEDGIDTICRRFYRLTEELLRVNAAMNLTAITEPRAIMLRHYVDSLTLLPHIPVGARVLDVGCGAGFPSLPLAIARPDLHITALDSTDKKVRYVNQTAVALGIDHRLSAITARAEDAASAAMPPAEALRERFDVVVSRAVAALNLLDELCLPFLRVGGRFIAMKGARAAEEYQAAQNGYRILGAEPAKLLPAALCAPDQADAAADLHTLVIAEKVRKTPEIYPRKYAQILKKPL